MSQLNLDDNTAKYQIKGFKPGLIQVNDQALTKSIIIGRDVLITDWEPQHIDELTADHLKKILALTPAILIIGTGQILHFPSIDVYGDLINQGIGVEIMNTSAACHTYNILSAEGRNVIAALIIS